MKYIIALQKEKGDCEMQIMHYVNVPNIFIIALRKECVICKMRIMHYVNVANIIIMEERLNK
jgi:hypothetical protein